MKPEELMIGDYIMFNKNTYIIEEISKKGWAHLIDNDGSERRVQLSTDYILDAITPIPLTAEILEKNGFVPFVRFKDMVLYKSADNRIEANNHEEMVNSFNKWSIHVDTENMMTMGYFEITYVHELQHALQLCGFEKKIEL